MPLAAEESTGISQVSEPTATSYVSTPYWWEGAPPADRAEEAITSTCDVVIVGAGYTGLSAAITLARAGRSVQVMDRMRAGEGASTRNGGVTSGHLRLRGSALAKRFGQERATAMMQEVKEARQDLYDFIRDENIECDFGLVGRFTGAMNSEDYEFLAREAELEQKSLGTGAHAVRRAEQEDYIATDFYHGGYVQMHIGGLNPAKLHAGMMRVAISSGATIHTGNAVKRITPEKSGVTVETARGTVTAKHVLIATNGYTDGLDPWLRRRIVPVRSRIVATEELSQDVVNRLMPRAMMYTDTRALSYYYRPSPDGRRILFGGRDGTVADNHHSPTKHLYEMMIKIFPELAGVGISHSWFGYVGMQRDMVPRIFNRNGLCYSTGYCGSGVVWARWCGKMAAQQILGRECRSAFDFAPPAAVPLFRGTAWFMPATFLWMKMKDSYRGRRG